MGRGPQEHPVGEDTADADHILPDAVGDKTCGKIERQNNAKDDVIQRGGFGKWKGKRGGKE